MKHSDSISTAMFHVKHGKSITIHYVSRETSKQADSSLPCHLHEAMKQKPDESSLEQ